jgi:hypothetical protein
LHARDRELIGQLQPNPAIWDAESQYSKDYANMADTSGATSPHPQYKVRAERVVLPGSTASGRPGLGEGKESEYSAEYLSRIDKLQVVTAALL